MAKVIITIEDSGDGEDVEGEDVAALGFHLEYIPERQKGEPKSPSQQMAELMMLAGISLMGGVPIPVTAEEYDEGLEQLADLARIRHRARDQAEGS